MVRIITDSTAELHTQLQQELSVSVVPLAVNFGPDEVYQEGIDLSTAEFYEKLEQAKNLPTTSQPSPEQFLTLFEQAKQANEDVVAVLLSSKLSGTMQSARLAAELSGWQEHIFLVDSLSTTLGLQILVRRAVELRNAGYTAASLAAQLEGERRDIRLYAVVDTLTYLQKGGRLPKAAAVAGTLLGIKPVVALKEGKLQLVGKARGLAGAYVNVFKQITGASECLDTSRPYALGYTGNPARVRPFKQYICENLHLPEPPVEAIGAVVGTHAGPGACGIAYFAHPADRG